MPDIDVAMVADAFAFERSVHDGKLLQRDDGGAGEERHEGQACAVALFESGFVLVAQLYDARQVHLEHAVDVGAGAARLDHAMSDDLAHLGHGHQVAGNRGRSRRSAAESAGGAGAEGARWSRRGTRLTLLPERQ